jgi:hypothetical protein
MGGDLLTLRGALRLVPPSGFRYSGIGMVLARVFYEVSKREADALLEAPPSGYHEIDREVRLELTSGTSIFISWFRRDDRRSYGMAFAERRFCPSAPPVAVEVSAWPMWKGLLGRPVSVRFADRDRLVVEVRAGPASIYCAARRGDGWGQSGIRIGSRLELPPGGDGAVDPPPAGG